MITSDSRFPQKRLRRVVDVRPSGVDKLTVEEETPVILCNYMDVYKNDRITDSLPFIAATATFAEIKRFSLETGDVLITKDSETPDDIAAAAIVDPSAAGIICGYHLALLRPDPRHISGSFLFWALKSIDALEQFSNRAQGITRFGLTTGAISDVMVSVPTPSEQTAIAAFLDRETGKIDALVAEQERLIALLKEKRQAVISHAVTKGLNPDAPMKDSGVPWLGKVPAHWCMIRAKTIFARSALACPPHAEVVTCFRDGQVTLRSNRREDGFTMAILEVGYQGIRPGQLVLHSMDAFAGAIGVSESEGKCSPEYLVCEPIIEGVDTDYYGRLLRLMALRGFILAACPSVRERAPRIRFPEFGELVLPFPAEDEQRNIVACIRLENEKIDSFYTEATRAVALLRERRAALISAAVTGKIDVRNTVPATQDAA